MVPVGADGSDVNCLARRLGFRDDRGGREVEGDAENVRVLDAQQVFSVEIAGLAAEGASDHLLAQQLGTEGPHPENMGHGVGVPALAQHGHRDDAAYRFTEPSRFPDGVHDLPEQVLVTDVLGLTAVAGALDDVLPKALDFGRRHPAKARIEGIAGLELFAVDEEGTGAAERAAVVVEVPEQLQASVLEDARAVILLAVEAGDVVVYQHGRGGVVADHDEARWHGKARLIPESECLLVVPVDGVECGSKLGRKAQGIERTGLSAAPFGHAGSDVFPQLAVHGHLVARYVVRDRDARQLDDAALDGAHEGEVAHRPGKQGALRVAGAAEKEGRGGEVDHP